MRIFFFLFCGSNNKSDDQHRRAVWWAEPDTLACAVKTSSSFLLLESDAPPDRKSKFDVWRFAAANSDAAIADEKEQPEPRCCLVWRRKRFTAATSR